MTGTTAIRYLGHAGFIVEHGGLRILMDPWFYPAFLGSWFPLPDNRPLLERVLGERFDYLYISHTHEDHLDERFLARLDKSVTVVVPDYRTGGLARRLTALGFSRQIKLGHQASVELAPGLGAAIFLDTSHKEDSGLLLDLGGTRFLDLNDCNTPMSELPAGVDLLAAQYSGAQWYPDCYDYAPDVMRQKVATVRRGFMETLARKVMLTGAKTYIPCAGPACFLDPVLAPFNDRDAHIFPVWEDVAADFARRCPGVEVLRPEPGDTVRVEAGRARMEPAAERRPGAADEDLSAYAERRRDEWGAFHAGTEPEVTSEELATYFGRLQRRNRHLLHDFSKTVRLVAGGHRFGVRLGQLAQDFVIEGEEPYDPEYTLVVPPRVLAAILRGHTGWEEALLSMRIGLSRDPDAFDPRFMGLLRYGNEPVQTLFMAREAERSRAETIERDGLRMQRYCPHAGEDLTHATVCNGVIECPRHHWKWDAATGRCLEGGNIPLKVEPAGPGAETPSQRGA